MDERQEQIGILKHILFDIKYIEANDGKLLKFDADTNTFYNESNEEITVAQAQKFIERLVDEYLAEESRKKAKQKEVKDFFKDMIC